MISYKLAKELKEAGFPIVEHADRGPEERTHGFFRLKGAGGLETVYIPSLEELIEACGEGFKFLTCDDDLISDLTNLHWAAGTKDKTLEVGSTPSEALARLWLALNKKAK